MWFTQITMWPLHRLCEGSSLWGCINQVQHIRLLQHSRTMEWKWSAGFLRWRLSETVQGCCTDKANHQCVLVTAASVWNHFCPLDREAFYRREAELAFHHIRSAQVQTIWLIILGDSHCIIIELLKVDLHLHQLRHPSWFPWRIYEAQGCSSES